MASGIARGRICTTTTDSRKMAAILQLIGCFGLLRTSLILDIHVMVNWQLSKQGIHWPAALRDYIASLSLDKQ